MAHARTIIVNGETFTYTDKEDTKIVPNGSTPPVNERVGLWISTDGRIVLYHVGVAWEAFVKENGELGSRVATGPTPEDVMQVARMTTALFSKP